MTAKRMTAKPSDFHLPAEWAPQEAVILSWPHNRKTWPSQLERVRQTYLRIIREIGESQQVWVNVLSHDAKIDLRRRLILSGGLNERVRFFVIPTYDAWVRDYGPFFLVGPGRRLMKAFKFNGWGGKYEREFLQDGFYPARLARALGTECVPVDFVLEGGSIEVNESGTLVTSTNCLLNPNRNPGYTQNSIEAVLREHLGVKKVVWVNGEIQGDDTDGHIDDAVRFVSDTTLVCVCEENKDDPNYVPTQNIYRALKNSYDASGRPFEIVKLPMPDPVFFQGMRLPASYANFLITNDKVLVPTYRCRQDEVALSLLKALFARRRVIGIDATDLVCGFGSIHCLSMQIPQPGAEGRDATFRGPGCKVNEKDSCLPARPL